MAPSNRPRSRSWLLALIIVVCAGLITWSVAVVRYRVDGVPTPETEVTRDSLTHSVERGPDGALTRPGGDAAPVANDAAQPCPT